MSDQHSSPGPSMHSVEVERRLVLLEEQGRGHTQKLSLHEKAILALAGSVYVVAQEQFPRIAAIIRSLLLP